MRSHPSIVRDSRRPALAAFIACVALGSAARAAEPAPGPCAPLVSVDAPWTEGFDGLAKSGATTKMPLGIVALAHPKGNHATAGDGSAAKGGSYAFGAKGKPERALGTLRDDKLAATVGVCFVNQTGVVVGALALTAVGETWRIGGGEGDRLEAAWSQAMGLDSGTWQPLSALDVTAASAARTAAPGARDGNDPANRASLAATIDGLVLAPGETIFVRWSDLDIAGAEDGLAIDDLTVTARAAPPAALAVVQSARIEGVGADRQFVYTLEVAHAPGSGQAAKGVIAELLLPPGSVRAGEARLELVDAKGSTLLTPAQDGDAGSATDGFVAIVMPIVEHGGSRRVVIGVPLAPETNGRLLLPSLRLTYEGGPTKTDPQAVTQTLACGGGSANVGGDCVCPEGTAWADAERQCKALVCAGGSFARGNACVCGDGYHWQTAKQQCVTCVGGTTRQGEECVCPEGAFWSNEHGDCRRCTGGTFYNGQQCVCPEGQFWSNAHGECRRCVGGTFFNGQQCVCPDGSFWSNDHGECRQCLGGSFFNGQQCVCPNGSFWSNDHGECRQCLGGTFFNGQQCVCPNGQTWNQGAGRCESASVGCSGGAVPDGIGGCKCTGRRTWQGNMCLCPSGMADEGAAGCRTPNAPSCHGGQVADSAGRCACPSGRTWSGSYCEYPRTPGPTPTPKIDRYEMPKYPSPPFVLKYGGKCKEFTTTNDNKRECQNYCTSLIATNVVQNCTCMDMITHCDGRKDVPVRVP